MSINEDDKVGIIIGNTADPVEHIDNNISLTEQEKINQKVYYFIAKKLNLAAASSCNTKKQCLVDELGNRYLLHLEEQNYKNFVNKKTWPLIHKSIYESDQKLKEYLGGYDKIVFAFLNKETRNIKLIASGLDVNKLLELREKAIEAAKSKDKKKALKPFFISHYNSTEDFYVLSKKVLAEKNLINTY